MKNPFLVLGSILLCTILVPVFISVIAYNDVNVEYKYDTYKRNEYGGNSKSRNDKIVHFGFSFIYFFIFISHKTACASWWYDRARKEKIAVLPKNTPISLSLDNTIFCSLMSSVFSLFRPHFHTFTKLLVRTEIPYIIMPKKIIIFGHSYYI